MKMFKPTQPTEMSKMLTFPGLLYWKVSLLFYSSTVAPLYNFKVLVLLPILYFLLCYIYLITILFRLIIFNQQMPYLIIITG